MKKLICLFVLASFGTTISRAQAFDSTIAQKIADKSVAKVTDAIEKVIKPVADSTLVCTAQPPALALKPAMVDFLVLLPVIFYVITLWVVTGKLKKEGVKLSWFLLDKELIAQLGKQTAQVETARFQSETARFNAIAKAPTPEAAAALSHRPVDRFQPEQSADDVIPPPPEEGKESVSRLIALLAGLVTLGLASCLTSFYLYKSFTGHPEVDLCKIATVLYGLGLGLIPYGFTKVAGVLKG